MTSFEIDTCDLEIPIQYINIIKHGFKIFKYPSKFLVTWSINQIIFFYIESSKRIILTSPKNIVDIFELEKNIHLIDNEGGIYKLQFDKEVKLVEQIQLDCIPMAITSVQCGFAILKLEKEIIFLDIYEKTLESINYKLFASIKLPGIFPQMKQVHMKSFLISVHKEELNRFLKQIIIFGEMNQTIFIALYNGPSYYISFNFDNNLIDKLHFLPHLNQPVCNLFLQSDQSMKYNNIIVTYRTGIIMQINAKNKMFYETISTLPSEVHQITFIDKIILSSDSINLWEHRYEIDFISNKLDLKGVDFICSLESFTFILTEMGIIYKLSIKSTESIKEAQKQIENLKQHFEIVEPQNKYLNILNELITKNKKIIEALNIATSCHLNKININPKIRIFSLDSYFLKMIKKESIQTINYLFAETEKKINEIYVMEIFIDNPSNYFFDKDIWSLFLSIKSNGRDITNVTTKINSHFIPSHPLHLLMYVHLKEFYFPLEVTIKLVSELYTLVHDLGSPWIYVLLSELKLDVSYLINAFEAIQYIDEPTNTNQELPLAQKCIYSFKIPNDFKVDDFLKALISKSDITLEEGKKVPDKWNLFIANIKITFYFDWEKEILRISSNHIPIIRFFKSIVNKLIQDQSGLQNSYDFYFVKEKTTAYLEQLQPNLNIKQLHDIYQTVRSEFSI